MHKETASLDGLAKKIAGEIVLSENPGNTIQKWRNIFKIPQRQLADKMDVMPSVISDYESGRRKSPGVNIIQRIVNALIELDGKNGSPVTKEFNALYSKEMLNDAILDIKECATPISVGTFSRYVKGEMAVGENDIDKKIYGYTIIDSLKAILELSPTELMRLYGLTTERAMIFTNIASGKSPLIAIKVANLKPNAVVFHGIKELDPLAARIAKAEGIPVIISRMASIDELIAALRTQIKSE